MLGVSWTGAGYEGLGVSATGGKLGGLEGLGGVGPIGMGVEGTGDSAITGTVGGYAIDGVPWVGGGGRTEVSAMGGRLGGVG